MATLRAASASCGFLVGFPNTPARSSSTPPRSSRPAQVRATHRKSCLPNYKVFDEKRYFKAGGQPTVVDSAASASASWSARTSGSRSPRSSRVRRARKCSWCSTPRRTRSTSNAIAKTSSALREGARAARGVREHAGRPGRAGVRRQFLRDGWRRQDRHARAAVRGRALPSRVRARRWRRACRCRRTVAPRARRCGERVSRAGPGRARLRRQTRLSRRGHGPVGRHRFRAHARDRRRRAGQGQESTR